MNNITESSTSRLLVSIKKERNLDMNYLFNQDRDKVPRELIGRLAQRIINKLPYIAATCR